MAAGAVAAVVVAAGVRAEEGVTVAVCRVCVGGIGSGGGRKLSPRRVTVVHQLLFRLGCRRISGDCTRRYTTATIFPKSRARRGRAFGRLSAVRRPLLARSWRLVRRLFYAVAGV
ncbi:hypothetical protein GZL_03911 [Streptomyces sp. 769]|nr:hypothetical protein GZL_03911 [Streptomyces sp. 769]